jgi:hypothetical protein
MSSRLLGVPALRVGPASVATVEGVDFGVDASNPDVERLAVLAAAGAHRLPHLSQRGADSRAGSVADADLPVLLDQFEARQVLHVTFGQVLTERSLAEPLLAELRKRPEAYADTLERHFLKHLRPFAAAREEATP